MKALFCGFAALIIVKKGCKKMFSLPRLLELMALGALIEIMLKIYGGSVKYEEQRHLEIINSLTHKHILLDYFLRRLLSNVV